MKRNESKNIINNKMDIIKKQLIFLLLFFFEQRKQKLSKFYFEKFLFFFKKIKFLEISQKVSKFHTKFRMTIKLNDIS